MPHPGSVQGQAGQGSQQCGLVEGVPAHARVLGIRWSLRVPSNPNHSAIPSQRFLVPSLGLLSLLGGSLAPGGDAVWRGDPHPVPQPRALLGLVLFVGTRGSGG